MLFFVIILGIAVLVLLSLLLAQKREQNDMAKQLRRLTTADSNELLQLRGGGRGYRELLNEINAALKELRRVKGEYRRKSHELEQMMTNISHDLRTPLTSALGYIGMIRGGGLTEEEKRRELAIVEKRLLRLEELIDSFFEFSRVISGEEEPEKEELNLVAVLEEAVAHYYDDFVVRERAIRLDCAAARLSLVSNRNMLLRIFDNLIANAYRHGEGDLEVTVQRLRPDCAKEDSGGGSVRICFANPLLNRDLDAGRVFDEFYTTDISRTRGDTGLGLAIARQFTRLLGGNILAEYDGRRFSVTLRF